MQVDHVGQRASIADFEAAEVQSQALPVQDAVVAAGDLQLWAADDGSQAEFAGAWVIGGGYRGGLAGIARGLAGLCSR